MSTLARAHARQLRAVALDLDGTLSRSDKSVSDATAKALGAFVAGGGLAWIATGRGVAYTGGVARDLAARGVAVDAIVCSDGAVAKVAAGDGAFDECVLERQVAGAAAAAVLARIAEAAPGATFAAEIEAADGVVVSDRAYLDAVATHNAPFFDRMLRGKAPAADFLARVRAAPRVNWVRAVAAPSAAPGRLLAVASLAAAGADGLRVQPSTLDLGPREAVILKPDTDKGVGLAAVAAARGVAAADVCAFGDAGNDLEMLDWAGAAVCPSNASPDATRRATFISALSNDEDFIVDALARPFASIAR